MTNELDSILQSFDNNNLLADNAYAAGQCEPGFMSDYLLPLTERAVNALPQKDSFSGQAIDSVTNVYTFADSLEQDLCDGRVRTDTAKDGAKVIGSGIALAGGLTSSVSLGALGFTVGGPVGLVAGVTAGAAIGVGGSYLAHWGVDRVSDIFGTVTDSLRDYLQGHR